MPAGPFAVFFDWSQAKLRPQVERLSGVCEVQVRLSGSGWSFRRPLPASSQRRKFKRPSRHLWHQHRR